MSETSQNYVFTDRGGRRRVTRLVAHGCRSYKLRLCAKCATPFMHLPKRGRPVTNCPKCRKVV